MDDSSRAGRGPVRDQGVQQALGTSGRGALAKYQELVVGRGGLGRLVLHELVVTCVSWIPGAAGLVLRRICYPWLLGSVGHNPTFGYGIVLRHPGKIRLGDDVVIDDLVVLDAKGTTNRGITIGSHVFLGRGTILSCKNGDIAVGDHVNMGFHCEIFSGSSVTVGEYGLFAAQSYLVGGGHALDAEGVPVIEQERNSLGIRLGANVWLGTGAKVLDGVTIGRNVVIGANAVVNLDLPDGAVAAGVPARILRQRGASDAGR